MLLSGGDSKVVRSEEDQDCRRFKACDKSSRRKFVVKEPSLAPYRALVRQLLKTFEEVKMSYMPRSNNQYVDALATLRSNLVFNEEAMSVAVVKRHVPMTEMLEGKMQN